jgi:hypothetical protein
MSRQDTHNIDLPPNHGEEGVDVQRRQPWLPPLRWVLEACLAATICWLALLFVYPLSISQMVTHLWSHTDDPYALGDLSGTLYMVARRAWGEVGCLSASHGWPLSYDVCSEYPNPLVTNLLASSVHRYGLPYGYNLGVIGVLVSNGMAVHLAARLGGARTATALVGAVVATASPAIFYEIEGGYVAHSWWAPSVAGFSLLILAVKEWRYLGWAIPGVYLLTLALESYGMNPMMLAPWPILTFVALAWSTKSESSGAIKALIIRSAILLLVSSVALLPFVSSGLSMAGPRLFEGPANASNLMIGLEAFTLDSWFGFTWGAGTPARTPGIIVWLTIIGAVVSYRRWKIWAPALLTGFILVAVSLGPSLNGGTSASGFVDSMPYVLLMEHLPIARGAMRPNRYGVAGIMMLAVMLPLVMTLCIDWCERQKYWPSHRRLFVWLLSGLLSLGLAMQLRPSIVSPSLEWPQFTELPASSDSDVWLELPIIGTEENRFSRWVMNPAPRLNPAHELVHWREYVEGEGMLLVRALLAIEQGREPEREWLRELSHRVPEIKDFGLTHVVVHLTRRDEDTVEQWTRLLGSVGGELLVETDRVRLYRLTGRGPHRRSSPLSE